MTHSTLCTLSLSHLVLSLCVCLRLAQVPLGLIEATEAFGAKDKLLVLCRDARTFRSAQNTEIVLYYVVT